MVNQQSKSKAKQAYKMHKLRNKTIKSVDIAEDNPILRKRTFYMAMA